MNSWIKKIYLSRLGMFQYVRGILQDSLPLDHPVCNKIEIRPIDALLKVFKNCNLSIYSVYLVFSVSVSVSEISVLVTFQFQWHFSFSDILVSVTFQYQWYILVSVTFHFELFFKFHFEWHSILNDIPFWVTIHF